MRHIRTWRLWSSFSRPRVTNVLRVLGVSEPSFHLRFSNRIRGVPPEKMRNIQVMLKAYQPHLSRAEGQNA